MPVRNAAPTIQQAVRSVLDSDLPCDLYLVDDCSDVPIAQLIDQHPRIKIIRLDHSCGVANALNVGLQHILLGEYPYIARMDADDLAHVDRFSKQVAFLDAHPEIGLVGCRARFFDHITGATLQQYRPPVRPDEIRQALFYNSAILHPTWILRAEIVAQIGLYSQEFPRAEDYELLRR